MIGLAVEHSDSLTPGQLTELAHGPLGSAVLPRIAELDEATAAITGPVTLPPLSAPGRHVQLG